MIWKSRKLRISFQKNLIYFKNNKKLLLKLLIGVLLCWSLIGLIGFWSNFKILTWGFVIGFGRNEGSLAVFDLKDRRLTVIRLPANLLVTSVGGKGRYPLAGFSSLQDVVGEMDFKSDSVGLLLRTGVDAWEDNVGLDNHDRRKVKRELTDFFRGCFWRGGNDHLTGADCGRSWWSMVLVPASRVKLVDLQAEGWLEEVDYTQQPALEMTNEYYDRESDWWEDSLFKKTNAVYGVANSTQASGLARVVADHIEHWGGSVVKIGDWPDLVDNCELRIKSGQRKRLSYPIKKINSLFGCDVIEDGLGDYVVDILIVVGDELGVWAQEVVLLSE